MQLLELTRHTPRSIVRRTVAVMLVLLAAAMVAAGCGSDGGGGRDNESGIVGDEGPLAWLPAETWLVASANADAEALDRAVQTLDRLPVWALAESYLPAGDGSGLRRELFEQVAKQAGEGDGEKPALTADDLEQAFGDRAGVAVTSTDFESFGGDDAPVAAWVEVDDEEAALDAVAALTSGADSEGEHEGVEWRHAKEENLAYLVSDGLLVASTSPGRLEALIDVREGDGSALADDEVGRAVIEGGISGALIGVAVQTDPLLEAIPELVAAQQARAGGDGEDAGSGSVTDELGPVLKSAAVDGLVADWMSGSVTVDELGVRLRGAWSNPRELASPEVGSRELLERMPADAVAVQAGVFDGSIPGRLQDAWAEVRDAYDLDPREMAGECDAADRLACDFAAELAIAVLEDEELAEGAREAGHASMAVVQDTAPFIATIAGLAEEAAPRARPLDRRVYEVAYAGRWGKWSPPRELVEAARRLGLVVEGTDGGNGARIRVLPGSQLAAALRRSIDPESAAALRALGIDLTALLGQSGLAVRPQEVDGVLVYGFPQQAPSRVVPALKGTADVLGDAERYRELADLADPPDEVGSYGYVDLLGWIEGIFGALGSDAGDAQRVLPTIRNNLADVPGVLTWTARDDLDGEEVGTWDVVVPITE